ncbi:MAG: four helix bundle protein [Chitinophagales bacterium]|jgi:four helix bundle protein|nr:four helix bundle protein [Bacteroidota bacterium]MBK7567436.1 four helix bundle protein [Bacteroidota bacterium]MBP8915883.1 four helix bundle protein [Chitinophagales bacterium]MBP9221481.1 four helix bundle protein [Chitinophagales bacterium]MBP9794954.1 four helix bundle protein [Chitinophagales bacterium]
MADFKDLYAYKKGFELSMEIFEITKKFPPEEKYALTDQIRRSSRSICANIAEAFRKRRYPNHFISKLTDSDAENSETQVWLEFAFNCKYINENTFNELTQKSIEIGKLLSAMIKNPNNYLDKIKIKMD